MLKGLFRIFVFLLIASPVTSHAKPVCLDSDGEALVVNGDRPAARVEAVARAKWAAIEQSAGVSVKAETVVQNFALIDDAVIKQIKGVVSGHKILSETVENDICKIKINACIEPSTVGEALSSLSLNNSIAVFIPAYRPSAGYKGNLLEETNILSETLIGKIAEQGYIVVDVTPTGGADVALVDKAMKSGNFTSLRSKMYKSLSNLLLIGKADYTVSTKKGEDVGYGISMPFQKVTVRMTYRLVTREPSGKMIILAAGAEAAEGLANSTEDAAAIGLKSLAEKLAPTVIEKVSQYVKGVSRRIVVNVQGINDISTSFSVKEVLQGISWVASVEEKGLGEFVVSYPENSIYLANSLEQKGIFRVNRFTQYQLELLYTDKR